MSARSFDINSTKKQSMIRVTLEENSRCVMMYQTCIVAWNFSGVTLNSGSWRTATTKVAINRALAQIPRAKGYAVVQKKGVWYVSKPDNSLVEFTDGMSINF